MAILNIIVTIFLGIIGLYLTHSFRRQVKQKTADARMKSYSELWAITFVARPTRLKEWQVGTPGGPLTPEERGNLYVAFNEWYYRNGNGMFLGDGTRSLYLATKDNLNCPDQALKPSKLCDALRTLPEEQHSAKRGEMSIRQLSLLRARMRADLEVYGTLFFGKLRDQDKDFLEYCGEKWHRKPWSNQQRDVLE